MNAQQNPANEHGKVDREQVHTWILELCNSDTRENALLELGKIREFIPDLAPLLWHSFGTISALLLEITNIYSALSPPTLTAQQGNRVCNALALMLSVAIHPETRPLFLRAYMPCLLYPFLQTVEKSPAFEYLRLTSLGVIGALVKAKDHEVILFLLSTEAMPICLRLMENEPELTMTMATFIMQKILSDHTGLAYVCETFERYEDVANVLERLVVSIVKNPSIRLLKHVVKCYLCLTNNHKAREVLRQWLPHQLRDGTFIEYLHQDQSIKSSLDQLIRILDQ